MRKSRLLFLFVFAAVAVACKPAGHAAPFEVLDDQASALRDQFNADAGKVRVVMLVAPS